MHLTSETTQKFRDKYQILQKLCKEMTNKIKEQELYTIKDRRKATGIFNR